jgi:hypothetical protein
MLYALVPTLAALLLIGRVYRPWVGPPPGSIVRRHPLPFLARLRLHALPAAAVLAVAIVGSAVDRLPAWALLASIAVLLGVLLVPVQYTLTTVGIARGRTPARRWTEFAGVARRPGGARLQGIAGARGLGVWLAGSRDVDETVLLLRQLVRGSYQGHAHVSPATTVIDPTDGRRSLPVEAAPAPKA